MFFTDAWCVKYIVYKCSYFGVCRSNCSFIQWKICKITHPCWILLTSTTCLHTSSPVAPRLPKSTLYEATKHVCLSLHTGRHSLTLSSSLCPWNTSSVFICLRCVLIVYWLQSSVNAVHRSCPECTPFPHTPKRTLKDTNVLHSLPHTFSNISKLCNFLHRISPIWGNENWMVNNSPDRPTSVSGLLGGWLTLWNVYCVIVTT